MGAYIHQLYRYDLTTGKGAEAFKNEVFRIVGVKENSLTNSLYARAWQMGWQGASWEDVLYAFWDLCDMEGL